MRALIDAVVADAPKRRECVETLDTLVNHVAAHEVGHAIYSVRSVPSSLAHQSCCSMLLDGDQSRCGACRCPSACTEVNATCWLLHARLRRCERPRRGLGLLKYSLLCHTQLDSIKGIIRADTKTLLEEPRAELTALHFMPHLLQHGLLDQVRRDMHPPVETACCCCCRGLTSED